MASTDARKESGSNDSADTHIASDIDTALRNKEELPASQNGHAVTAARSNSSGNDTDPINRIETAPTNDTQGHHHGQTPQNGNRRASKVYVHGRNRKGSKSYTPDSAMKHLKPHKRAAAKKEGDLEAQSEDEDNQGTTVLQNFWIMLTTFPYWNMAFWSGWCYSIGSALFVIDGAWAWVPLGWPDTEFSGEEKYGVPLLFFFGACLYQVGGVMAYLEAVNDGCFAGSAMKRLLQGHQDLEKELLDAKLHVFFGHLIPHHHHDDDEGREASVTPQSNWASISRGETNPEDVYDEAKEKVERRGGVDQGGEERGQMTGYMKWQWYPTRHALFTYHIYELGYVACAIQLFGVTLYGVTSIIILPGILDTFSWGAELGAYWILQVIASCCFLTASIMFTIMAQDKWYQPKWGAVSWWIGIWAQVGSVGFL